MARTIWKGAISFGLVHVPIVVHAATRPHRLDFDWIDRRDDAPVGYQRINKRTGKVIASEDIVKGYEYEKGEYVYLNEEDFKRANVAATQTVEIQGFVDAAEVPIYYYDTPYYLAPDRRGEKGYVLLREVLKEAGRLGLARVVLHTRQYLCALLPQGDALMLITLRYGDEILSADDLELPGGKTAAPAARERDMALRLVEDMTGPWDPQAYRDDYREDLLDAIEKKVKAGKTHVLTEADETQGPRESAKVIDLMSLLKQSIEQRGAPKKTATKKTAAKKAAPAGKKASAARRTAAAKTPARKSAATRRKAA